VQHICLVHRILLPWKLQDMCVVTIHSGYYRARQTFVSSGFVVFETNYPWIKVFLYLLCPCHVKDISCLVSEIFFGQYVQGANTFRMLSVWKGAVILVHPLSAHSLFLSHLVLVRESFTVFLHFLMATSNMNLVWFLESWWCEQDVYCNMFSFG